MIDASELNDKNNQFWSEPCGTNAMLDMGINPMNLQEVEKFDDWYFDFYPYLLEYLNKIDFKDAHVLEVGIGLGTVSRFLAQRASSLTCLDIAEGATSYVKSTLKDHDNVKFICQSVLDFLPMKKFDVVIAIGSLHHTGNLENALVKIEKMLRDNGTILVMVYYAFQPRRCLVHPLRTLKEFVQTSFQGPRNRLIFEEHDAKLRARADANQAGEAAPYTAFSSRRLFNNRVRVEYEVELKNFHRVPILSGFLSRNFFLKYFSRFAGCDIYAFGKCNTNLQYD
jgi:2-polyprenyl-3-methyl-5-hydroxy-6-metoxy-1,4-benzoquinol methylase